MKPVYKWSCFYYQGQALTVTVQEGKIAILRCPGYVPNLDRDRYAIFMWHKGKQTNVSHQNRVAIYEKADGFQNSFGDLEGRALIDSTTGALKIPQTRLSDDHVYTCWFMCTASGLIKNEAELVITGTIEPVNVFLRPVN